MARCSVHPGATLEEVLSVIRDCEHYKQYYHPAVVSSKSLATDEGTDRFSMLLVNKSMLTKTALDGDYQSSYFRPGPHRAYSISETTRMQEVVSFQLPDEHTLPENQGTGLIWKLLSITRFEERDGGVYIELEAIALSRDIPVSLRWIATPIVRRLSRNSLLTSLQQTSDAVLSHKTMSAHTQPHNGKPSTSASDRTVPAAFTSQ